MVIVLENEFQLLYPVFMLILKIDVIKPDEEELGGFLYIKRVAVLRHYQEQFPGAVGQLVLVHTLHASAFHYIYKLKKVVFMRIYRALCAFPVFNLKRLI